MNIVSNFKPGVRTLDIFPHKRVVGNSFKVTS
jgi:hypothetical protein